VIETFKSWIEEIQEKALEEKRAKAREKGDESKWKKEIWTSPAKNKAIKVKFAVEGKSRGYQVRSAHSKNEWLYDVVWRKMVDNHLVEIPLAVEIEMSDDHLGIIYDFNKLLQAESKYKVLVFQTKTKSDVDEVFQRVDNAIQQYQTVLTSHYLLCGWSTALNSFLFHTPSKEFQPAG
jgi:hypothetical protein